MLGDKSEIKSVKAELNKLRAKGYLSAEGCSQDGTACVAVSEKAGKVYFVTEEGACKGDLHLLYEALGIAYERNRKMIYIVCGESWVFFRAGGQRSMGLFLPMEGEDLRKILAHQLGKVDFPVSTSHHARHNVCRVGGQLQWEKEKDRSFVCYISDRRILLSGNGGAMTLLDPMDGMRIIWRGRHLTEDSTLYFMPDGVVQSLDHMCNVRGDLPAKGGGLETHLERDISCMYYSFSSGDSYGINKTHLDNRVNCEAEAYCHAAGKKYPFFSAICRGTLHLWNCEARRLLAKVNMERLTMCPKCALRFDKGDSRLILTELEGDKKDIVLELDTMRMEQR